MNFQKIKGDIFVIIAGLMWGTMGVFSRYFNSIGLGSLEIAQLRITVGLLFVGSYLLIFHREKLKIKLRDVWCFIGTGIVSLLLFCVCYFKAIEKGGPIMASLAFFIKPILTPFVTLVVNGIVPDFKVLGAVVCVVAASYFATYKKN